MQKSISKLPISTAKRVLLKPTHTRKMSFFPGPFINAQHEGSFTPLFRLLDDFDSYSRNTTGQPHHRSHLKSFQPKFDVKELKDAYELHGELPGIEQKDVDIEFTDRQTLTVRGRTERSYTSGTPPAGVLGAPKATGAITEGGEQPSHKVTVEDVPENEDAQAQQADGTEVAKSSTQVANPPEQKPEEKYWVSERSVGQFSRSFSFPATIDQDNVKASMKNGILSILVPKAKKHESRKITIS